MKKLLLTLFISASFLVITNKSQAQNSQTQGGQDYKTAVGLKFGAYEDGISIKYFPTSDVSYEGIIGFRSHGVVFTGLYELNQEAFNVPQLKFYYGFGAHIGAVGKGDYNRFGNNEYYNSSHILLGVDGTIGLEYRLPDAPIAFSLDLNPRIELASGPYFDLAPGLGLKYTF
ncbi:MAG: hypothetical protein ACHQF4_06905 [Sphingobacteriales bacterium]